MFSGIVAAVGRIVQGSIEMPARPAGAADDAEAPQIEPMQVEDDLSAAMSAGSHHAATARHAAKRLAPELRIADVLEDHVHAASVGQPLDL